MVGQLKTSAEKKGYKVTIKMATEEYYSSKRKHIPQTLTVANLFAVVSGQVW